MASKHIRVNKTHVPLHFFYISTKNETHLVTKHVLFYLLNMKNCQIFDAEVYRELTSVSYKKIQLPPGSRQIKICEKCPVPKGSTKGNCVVQ